MNNYSPTTVAKRFLHTSLALRHSPLPAKLKAEVHKAMWKIDSASLGRRNSIDLLGLNLSFAGEVAFRHIFNEVFANACYYFEADTDTPNIVDCGGNIGLSVLFFKKLYPKATVTTFEPDALAFDLLNRNTAGLGGVVSHQFALGGEDGTVDFHRDPNDSVASATMSTDPNRHRGKTVQVQQRRLSQFITTPIDLLKIDVEGAERSVMADLVETGKIASIKAMHVEYHHHISGPDNLSSFLAMIETAGFSYQLDTVRGVFAKNGSFQDVSLYCYRIPA